MDQDQLFRRILAGLRLASPAIARAPAFAAVVEAAIDAFDGDARQEDLKAAYARARTASDSAEADFTEAAAGR